MDMKEWIKLLENKSTEIIQKRLKDTLESIKFLESIYMTGGENSYYSKAFKQAASNERGDLCQLSSAMYAILRSRGL